MQNFIEFYQSDIPSKQNKLNTEIIKIEKNTIPQTNKAESIFNELLKSINAEDEYIVFLKGVLNKTNPTDLAHYLAIDVTKISYIKHFILKYGSCRPQTNFPLDEISRSFSSSYYFIDKLKTHERFQLCYFPILDRSYCEPC
jgi:hypothetical protein